MQDDLPLVGYPRRTELERYGTTDQLQALGKACVALAKVFVVQPFLHVGFFLCLVQFLASQQGPYLFGALVAVALIASQTVKTMLAVGLGLGWKRPVAYVSAVAASLVVPLWCLHGLRDLNLIFYGSLFTFFAGASMVAWRVWVELRRYGVALDIRSPRQTVSRFSMAVSERRAIESNPYPPVPADMYSGEGP